MAKPSKPSSPLTRGPALIGESGRQMVENVAAVRVKDAHLIPDVKEPEPGAPISVPADQVHEVESKQVRPTGCKLIGEQGPVVDEEIRRFLEDFGKPPPLDDQACDLSELLRRKLGRAEHSGHASNRSRFEPDLLLAARLNGVCLETIVIGLARLLAQVRV